jgi:hypothetical protein
MRVIDAVMVVGGLIVAVFASINGGWPLGIAAFFLYMFLFAMARFAAAMFRRRKRNR